MNTAMMISSLTIAFKTVALAILSYYGGSGGYPK